MCGGAVASWSLSVRVRACPGRLRCIPWQDTWPHSTSPSKYVPAGLLPGLTMRWDRNVPFRLILDVRPNGPLTQRRRTSSFFFLFFYYFKSDLTPSLSSWVLLSSKLCQRWLHSCLCEVFWSCHVLSLLCQLPLYFDAFMSPLRNLPGPSTVIFLGNSPVSNSLLIPRNCWILV